MLNQFVSKALAILLLTLFSGLMITPGLYITSPEKGAVVEGVVEIRGSVPEDGFSSAELQYAYSQSAVETWFLIKRLDHVVQDDVLASWDTTTITDGLYRIKLVVQNQDGKENEVIVDDVQVSNYSRVQGQPEGDLPEQTGNTPSAVEVLVATPAPTELISNPASILRQEVRRTVVSGIIFACATLGLLVLYTSIQSRRRRR